METVKGFKDYQGEEAQKRAEIQKIIVETFEKYGFEPAETPVIEYREFVQGDNVNDEAVSDIFKLEDRGKRKLALRYEFTFQLKRLMKNQKLPYKRYQIGPVFRDEPVKPNRFRQFIQCDADIIGSTVKEEAEVLAVVKNVLEKLNLEAEIYINNRKLLNEILEKENIEKLDWEKIIREIDKLDKLDEDEVYNNLRGYGAQNLIEMFNKPEKFFEKYSSYQEIKQLKEFCSYYDIQLIFKPSLARGLSYYNGSVFEIKAEGIKDSIGGGGSYMFNNVQSTGFAFGLDRLSIVSKKDFQSKNLMVLSISQDKEAIKIAESLREKGITCIFISDKIKKSMDYANSKKIRYVLFVGEEEVKTGKLTLKDMINGKEKKLSLAKIISELLR
jgi:histidyl-tRNA synthetase